jgi:hypothetical protein
MHPSAMAETSGPVFPSLIDRMTFSPDADPDNGGCINRAMISP